MVAHGAEQGAGDGQVRDLRGGEHGVRGAQALEEPQALRPRGRRQERRMDCRELCHGGLHDLRRQLVLGELRGAGLRGPDVQREALEQLPQGERRLEKGGEAEVRRRLQRGLRHAEGVALRDPVAYITLLSYYSSLVRILSIKLYHSILYHNVFMLHYIIVKVAARGEAEQHRGARRRVHGAHALQREGR